MNHHDPATRIGMTILDQLGGIPRLRLMVGMKDLCITERGACFKIGSGAKRKINTVWIQLLPDDTYEVRFERIWGGKHTTLETWPGVHADMLPELCEQRTGFYLTLAPRA